MIATKSQSSGTSKLTAYQAAAVCELAHKGVDENEIAALFGIHTSSVKQIKRGRSWFKETAEVRRKYQTAKGVKS